MKISSKDKCLQSPEVMHSYLYSSGVISSAASYLIKRNPHKDPAASRKPSLITTSQSVKMLRYELSKVICWFVHIMLEKIVLKLLWSDGVACRHSVVGRGESEHSELISSHQRHLSLRSTE